MYACSYPPIVILTVGTTFKGTLCAREFFSFFARARVCVCACVCVRECIFARHVTVAYDNVEDVTNRYQVSRCVRARMCACAWMCFVRARVRTSACARAYVVSCVCVHAQTSLRPMQTSAPAAPSGNGGKTDTGHKHTLSLSVFLSLSLSLAPLSLSSCFTRARPHFCACVRAFVRACMCARFSYLLVS